jgi:hypothetical protein
VTNAIRLIVDTYVRLGNRSAVQELKLHRQRLLVDLKALTGYRPLRAIEQISAELDVIEDGLARLDPPAPGVSADLIGPHT